MQKEILSQILEQNKKDCAHFCKNINAENSDYRLTQDTASVGFIFRHIGETMNLIGVSLGYKTTVEGTTIGQKDTGKVYNLQTSRQYFEKGYTILEKLLNDTADNEWLEEIETPWFGRISRINLFSIILFHNAHHCGQISSALLHGENKIKSITNNFPETKTV